MEMRAAELSHRRILKLYTPLALSWIFMAVEAPVCVAVISRKPNAEVSTAAYFLIMSVALWIESPVIDLLSTATTLAKDHASYLVLRKFVIRIMAIVTAVHALIAFTPVYDWLAFGLLKVPTEVANTARTGLQLMLPWSAAIGWRRYLQGIMIRFGRTKRIGYGTLVRVVAIITFCTSLSLLTSLPSIAITAVALIGSVTAEAAFVHWGSREIIRNEIPPSSEFSLSVRQLAAFHLPLTATTMVMFVGNPLITRALARSDDAVITLAAWQVALTLLWMMRTIVFALPEVVISLFRGEQSSKKLRDFCVIIGCVTTGFLIFCSVTGLDALFFKYAIGASEETIHVARLAFICGAPSPMLGALQSYVRGMLTAHHLTKARLMAVLFSISTLFGCLELGVWLRWPGVITASVAFTASLLVELGALTWAWRKGVEFPLSTGEEEVA